MQCVCHLSYNLIIFVENITNRLYIIYYDDILLPFSNRMAKLDLMIIYMFIKLFPSWHHNWYLFNLEWHDKT